MYTKKRLKNEKIKNKIKNQEKNLHNVHTVYVNIYIPRKGSVDLNLAQVEYPNFELSLHIQFKKQRKPNKKSLHYVHTVHVHIYIPRKESVNLNLAQVEYPNFALSLQIQHTLLNIIHKLGKKKC